MDNIKRDIEAAENLITNNSNYRIFSNIYPFTTENIKGYYDLFNFTNKDILTVGSSGDHTINLYLKQVKSVDYFDINPFSKYYFDLKFDAIKVLSHKEFLKFFCLNYPTSYTENDNRFKEELFEKIKLEGESKEFWYALYKEFTGKEIRDSKLFTKDEPQLSSLLKINSYLSRKNYDCLKQMPKIEHNFINAELSELPNKLEKQYDVIMLSNIAQYIEINQNIQTLEKFKEIILKLSKNLKKDGIIFLAYIYDIFFTYKQIDNLPLIYKTHLLEKMLGKEHLYQFEIDSIHGALSRQKMPIKDGIVIYKK